MRVREPMVTDEQWAKIETLIPKPKLNPKGGLVPEPMIAWCLKEYCGCSRRALDGRIFRTGIPPPFDLLAAPQGVV